MQLIKNDTVNNFLFKHRIGNTDRQMLIYHVMNLEKNPEDLFSRSYIINYFRDILDDPYHGVYHTIKVLGDQDASDEVKLAAEIERYLDSIL